MSAPTSLSSAERQLPLTGEVFLDHIAHFVPDVAAASQAMVRAGFHPTQVSIQRNRDSNGENRLTGTGNITAMLERGYIEILFKTADEPLGLELDRAIARYAGVHLLAFTSSNAGAERERLASSGFRVRPLAALKRPVETETGEAEAAFTVARIEEGQMREGRIQFLTHHTVDAVWQKRWLSHPNGTLALVDALIAVDDVDEAASRFARFLGRAPRSAAVGKAIFLERGGVQIVNRDAYTRLFGRSSPQPPFIGCYALRVRSLAETEAMLTKGGIVAEKRGPALLAPFPVALGQGSWMFVERDSDLPWRASPS